MRGPANLTSTSNPHVKAVVRLRQRRERDATGLFVAEGLREVRRALAARLALVELYWSPQRLVARDIAELRVQLPELASADPQARLFTVTEPALAKLSYRENPEGLLGVFRQPRWRLDELPEHPPGLWLVAAGTQKPGNLGAMARCAEAAGADGILVSDGEVDALNPNAVRASTGAVFTLPIVGVKPDVAVQFLRQAGCAVIAASPDGDVPYTDVDLVQPAALVIGAEAGGLDLQWRSAADALVFVPMVGRTVDSLNASVTAALLLFEARRQRGAAENAQQNGGKVL